MQSCSKSGGTKCSYKNCKNTSTKNRELSYFRYPVKDKERCKIWITNSGNYDLAELPDEKLHLRVLCALHFKQSAFCNSLRKKLLRQHPLAVPVPWSCEDPTKPTNLPDRKKRASAILEESSIRHHEDTVDPKVATSKTVFPLKEEPLESDDVILEEKKVTTSKTVFPPTDESSQPHSANSVTSKNVDSCETSVADNVIKQEPLEEDSMDASILKHPRKEIGVIREDFLPLDVDEPPPVKRKRGRPRKTVSNLPEVVKSVSTTERRIPKKRGRPRKVPLVTTEDCDGINREGCCALGCTNTSESFLMCPLPKDPEIRQQWIDNIGLGGCDISEYSNLCEVHFEPEVWEMSSDGQITMKPKAVPTRFLRGENIKSWVTMNQTGVVEGKPLNGGTEDIHDHIVIEESNLLIKSEILEPEIMVSNLEEPEKILVKEELGLDADQNCADIPANLLIEPIYPVEAECILPDVFVPSITEEYGDEVKCLESVVTHNVRNSLLKIPVTTEVTKKCEKKNLKETFRDKIMEKQYQCPLCMKRLARRRNLKYHLMKIHPDSEFTINILSEMAKGKLSRKENVLEKFICHPTVTSVSSSVSVTDSTTLSSATTTSSYVTSVPSSLSPISCPVITASYVASPVSPTLSPMITSSVLPSSVSPTLSPVITSSFVPSCVSPTLSPVITSSHLLSSVGPTSIPVTTSTYVTSAPPSVSPTSSPVITSCTTSAPYSVSPTSSPVITSSGKSFVNPTLSSVISTSLSVTPSNNPSILAAALTNNSLTMSGGEVKQFLLLVPQPAISSSTQPLPLNIPNTNLPLPPHLSKFNRSWFDFSEKFCVTLPPLPPDKLTALKRKLMELVEAVTERDLDPQKIIMVYSSSKRAKENS